MQGLRRCSVIVILVTVLSTLPGFEAFADDAPPTAPSQGTGICPRLSAAFHRFRAFFRGEAGPDVPPEPLHADAAQEQGGFLLRTGAIQLGPGTQENLWRRQGDGEAGF